MQGPHNLPHQTSPNLNPTGCWYHRSRETNLLQGDSI